VFVDVGRQFKALAYYEICPFAEHYESVVFYSTGPWCMVLQNNIKCLLLQFFYGQSNIYWLGGV